MNKETRIKLQQAYNDYIDGYLGIFFKSQWEFNERYVENGMRTDPLCHCQASMIFDYDNDTIIWLRSYKTVIACFDMRANLFFDFLRREYGYTKTSAQHIAKFKRYIKTELHKEIECEFRYYPV